MFCNVAKSLAAGFLKHGHDVTNSAMRLLAHRLALAFHSWDLILLLPVIGPPKGGL